MYFLKAHAPQGRIQRPPECVGAICDNRASTKKKIIKDLLLYAVCRCRDKCGSRAPTSRPSGQNRNNIILSATSDYARDLISIGEGAVVYTLIMHTFHMHIYCKTNCDFVWLNDDDSPTLFDASIYVKYRNKIKYKLNPPSK